MKVLIHKEAFLSLQNKFPFRAHTIAALIHLNDAQFSFSISDDFLSNDQKNILEQEKISYNLNVDAPDFSIHIKDGKLTLTDNQNEEIYSSNSWIEIAQYLTNPPRVASINRKTNETEISIDLNLNGTGKSTISTGLNFFDHMLDQIARHGLIDLSITCKGDLEVDEHHTIEDVAIALGETITKALVNKKGIERYSFVLPMDEAQSTVALDLSGRPYLVFDVPMKREYVGDFPTEMLEHFFYSLAMNLKATLHVSCSGNNDHHKIEACFKGFARALKTAIEQNGRVKNQIPSSKGSL